MPEYTEPAETATERAMKRAAAKTGEAKAKPVAVVQMDEAGLPVIPDPVTEVKEVKPEGYDGGIFIHRVDGLPYSMRVDQDDHRGKTHKLKNSRHFWEGNAEEFRAAFDKQ